MTVDEAMAMIDNIERDYETDALHEGVTILKKYSTEFIDFQFEHDQCWIGAMHFGEYIEVMSVADVIRMAVLGWFNDEDSWSHFS